MYQSSSSTSSSSQRSLLPGGAGLIRYGSAPGSLITSMVDEVISRYFTSYHPPSDNNFIGNFFTVVDSSDGQKQLDRSYGGFNELSQHKSNELGGGSSNFGSSYSLARQRSSPAVFFTYLTSDNQNSPVLNVFLLQH